MTPLKTKFQATAYHNLGLSRPKPHCGAKGRRRGITQVQMSCLSLHFLPWCWYTIRLFNANYSALHKSKIATEWNECMNNIKSITLYKQDICSFVTLRNLLRAIEHKALPILFADNTSIVLTSPNNTLMQNVQQIHQCLSRVPLRLRWLLKR
jgi:hypothetical protein